MPKYIALVACRDLKNDDGSSAKVSMIRADTGKEEEIGRTSEQMGDTPVFEEIFEFECNNIDNDLLKVTLLDENEQTRGVATFTIANIQEHKHNLACLEMSADRGTIVAHVAEKVEEGALRLILKAKDLKNTEGFTNLRKPDPFYVLSRWSDSDGWITVFSSPTKKDELNPTWNEKEIDIKALCNADFDLRLKLEIFDEESGDNHVIIGSLFTTVNELLSMDPRQGKPLAEKGEKTGELFVDGAELAGACVDSKGAAKKFFSAVGGALRARTSANKKTKEIEQLQEETAKANEAAKAAQLVADEKAQELAVAEGELNSMVAAAKEAEAAIGGLE